MGHSTVTEALASRGLVACRMDKRKKGETRWESIADYGFNFGDCKSLFGMCRVGELPEIGQSVIHEGYPYDLRYTRTR